MCVLCRYNMTPLMYAAREGRLTVVESLLVVTNNIDCQDNKGYTVCCVFCTAHYLLTPLVPAVPNRCCSKGSALYWSNPPYLIFDIWVLFLVLWHSGLSARALKIVG